MLDYSRLQGNFQQKYKHLTDQHVRDLAWLLDSPNLLDASAPLWHGQIASLFDNSGSQIHDWLQQLEHNPLGLHAVIKEHSFARLGRYAELLMAFFFRHLGVLYAHGLQVQAEKKKTIGEFDFLLWRKTSSASQALLHWEFATKFYLLEPRGSGQSTDHLLGPNLADTLGAKMRKILEKQLSLSTHPAAQAYLAQSIQSAQALVKGWLFYPADAKEFNLNTGVSSDHCCGFWRPIDESDKLPEAHYLILPRLKWLSPARATWAECHNRQGLRTLLGNYFAQDTLPVLIAIMRQGECEEEEVAFETERGFIVPNDWGARANHFIKQR